MRHPRCAVLTLAFLASVPAALAAQQPDPSSTPPAPNAVYFELGGNALLYSLNYERRFRHNLGGRFGIMYIAGTASTSEGESGEVDLVLLPLMVNGFLGGGSGRFELGLGPLFAGASGSGTTVEGVDVEFSGFTIAGVTSSVGYRYQPLDGGLVFRVALTPFWVGDPGIWAGLSLGYAF